MRLLSFAELRSVKGVGYSRAHIFRLMKAGKFPRPVKLNPPFGVNGWPEDEIDAHIEDCKRARDDEATAAVVADRAARIAEKKQ